MNCDGEKNRNYRKRIRAAADSYATYKAKDREHKRASTVEKESFESIGS